MTPENEIVSEISNSLWVSLVKFFFFGYGVSFEMVVTMSTDFESNLPA